MTPFITTDYEMLQAFCDYQDVALFKTTETGTIEDCNACAQTIFDTQQPPRIGMKLSDFLDQLELSLPPEDQYTTFYRRNHYETLKLKWSVLPVASPQPHILYAAEVVDNAIHSAVFSDQVFNTLNHFPIAIYCKDLYGTYVESNHYCDSLAYGAEQAQSTIGKTDQDLIWSDTALDLQAHDHEVMRGNSHRYCEHIVLADGTKALMQSTKSPLLDDCGKTIGMIGISVNTTLFAGSKLEADITLNSNPKSFETFSSREQECVSWLLNGLSARRIAECMGISKRTVEAHVNSIKLKTGSYKLFQAGFKLGIGH